MVDYCLGNLVNYFNLSEETIMKNLNYGDTFYGTNADLLNELGFRTNEGELFKKWYKSTYVLTDNILIWIVPINGENHNGWINSYQEQEKIIVETNLYNIKHPIGLTHNYRVVFEKTNNNNENIYTFKGLYKLNPASNNKVRLWERVVDKYSL